MADRREAPSRLIGAALALLLASAQDPAGAVMPSEVLADPALEERARVISKDLRCLVCQNQSIDDSDAELASDLRVLVRERLVAGDSDDQVKAYVVSRYGDFVLLRPPFKPSTYALWLGPAAIVAFGVGAVVLFYRRRQAAAPGPEPLSASEEDRLRQILEDRHR